MILIVYLVKLIREKSVELSNTLVVFAIAISIGAENELMRMYVKLIALT